MLVWVQPKFLKIESSDSRTDIYKSVIEESNGWFGEELEAV